MIIKNNKNRALFVIYKVDGVPFRRSINAGESVDIEEIKCVSQIVNHRDVVLGFLEISILKEKNIDIVREINNDEEKRLEEERIRRQEVEREVNEYLRGDGA